MVKVFANHISHKGLIAKIFKLLQLYSKKQKTKQKTDFKNGQRNWIDIFPKKTYRWPTGIWKSAWHYQASWKCKSKPTWGITSHLLEKLSSRRQETTSTGEDVEKRKTLCTVAGNVNWCSHYEKQYGASSKNYK